MKPHYTNTNNPVDFPKMNQRIRQLAEQAEDWADKQNFYESDYKDYFNEKFAELIVQACAKTIEAQDVDPSFKLRMSWAIKTQFGVEE
jgi:hypothetical protein